MKLEAELIYLRPDNCTLRTITKEKPPRSKDPGGSLSALLILTGTA